MNKKILLYSSLFFLILLIFPGVLAFSGVFAFPGNPTLALPNIDFTQIWNTLKDFFQGNFLKDPDNVITFMRILFFILLTAIINEVLSHVGVAWLAASRVKFLVAVIFSIIAVIFTPEVYFIFFGAQFSSIFLFFMGVASIYILIRAYNWVGGMGGFGPMPARLIRILMLIAIWISINTMIASIYTICTIPGISGLC